jgi:predicted Rossmann fold flavoprotein
MHRVVVIGGGAAGFFGACAIKRKNPSLHVTLLEKTAQLLAKVRISGGGRCNATHACFDVSKLILNYPRGGRELRAAFTRFQPQDTIAWFKARGVELKAEEDGRMFPITDSSETIIESLIQEAKNVGVVIQTGTSVERIEKKNSTFLIHIANKQPIECDKLLIATGSNKAAYTWLEGLGHTIEPLVPSLFTFNIPSSPLLELSGISVDPVQIKLLGLEQTGPILLTHWGFSGPCVLKLSAWGARALFECGYKAPVTINWICKSLDEARNTLQNYRVEHTKELVASCNPFLLPKNLWKRFCELLGIENKRYATLSNKELQLLAEKLTRDMYAIDGKTTYKHEFVTCGGVKLSEVDFRRMESKLIPNLFFAGEVLDIDGITGGFNFQAAWTTSWIAAESIAG